MLASKGVMTFTSYDGNLKATNLTVNYLGNMATLAKGVAIGDYEACDSACRYFDSIIHIKHERQPGHCKHIFSDGRHEYIDWLEHDPITKEMFDKVWNLASRQDTRLLVHCVAGIGRSAHASVIALAARGHNIGEAIGIVTNAELNHYHSRVIPDWDRENLGQIDAFIQSKLQEKK